MAKVKSSTYKFDCWDADDIAQEIRIVCYKVVSHFDWNRVGEGAVVSFFGKCVDNAMKNLKRDNYIRYSSPCRSDCSFLHSDSPDDKLTQVCKKWLNHKERQEKKKIIKNPISIEIVGHHIHDNTFQESVEVEDTKRFLIANIENELRNGLINMLSGNKKAVDIKIRRKVQASVKKILKD